MARPVSNPGSTFMIHPHSILAWRNLDIDKRTQQVFETLETIGHAATDREIRDAFDPRADMNSVRPQITRAVKSGYLEEVGSVKCPVTKETVRLVRFMPTSLFKP